MSPVLKSSSDPIIIDDFRGGSGMGIVGASWQFCHVHFGRAVLESMPNRDKPEIAERLRDASDNEMKMQSLATELEDLGHKSAAETIDSVRFDLCNCRAFPRSYWRLIRTTNSLERINKELKRRSRVAGAFSNDKSLLRVAVCLMMDINEEWMTGKR
jgi:transposase-like protein